MDKKNLDILVETDKEPEIKFSKSFKGTIYIATFLTGLISIMGILFFTLLITKHWSKEELGNQLVYNILYFISNLLCFVSLISIIKKKQPFSHVLVKCMYAIGIIHIFVGCIVSLIPGTESSGFELFLTSLKNFYIDGVYLSLGILIILFARILQYGFEYQRRSDFII